MQGSGQSKFKCKFKFKNIQSYHQSIKKSIHSSIHPFLHSLIHSFIFALSIFFLVFPGCSENKIIEENKLILIYTDLLIAQDTLSLIDNNLDSLRLSVLKKHDVSENEYNETIKYYNQDLERWEDFFDKVTKHLQSLQKKTN